MSHWHPLLNILRYGCEERADKNPNIPELLVDDIPAQEHPRALSFIVRAQLLLDDPEQFRVEIPVSIMPLSLLANARLTNYCRATYRSHPNKFAWHTTLYVELVETAMIPS
ncbi:hypothetical protein L914_00264 [Phytophthora nicotianae]|uniref:Uncharacterized protein n=1 Tax=Phytophthora nicotianae TaxID=4792 RepID=W2P7Q4_PHYNI|nr:hypothetical protein L914_00264 [Phytophthora nicotianae]